MKEQPLEPKEPREKPERDEMEAGKKADIIRLTQQAEEEQEYLDDEERMFIDFFETIQERAHQQAIDKGWWEDYNNTIKLLRQVYAPEECVMAYQKVMQLSKLMLTVSELGELTESLRKPGKPDEHCPQFTNTAIEAADVVIRLMDFCEMFGIPLAEAIIAKMKFNATRPHKHGKLV